MMLIEKTAVPDGSLPVDEFKAHLRLGSGFGQDSVQDAVLTSFLRAAVTAIEARTSKVLFERTFELSVRVWRDLGSHGLPVAPVNALTDLEIVARDGTRTSIDSATYWLERDGHVPRLRSTGVALPTVPEAGEAVVTFDAGFGVEWLDVPADLRQAVLLLAAHYYEFRNETSLSEGCMPFGVTSLIERYKVMRLYGGGTR